MEEKRHSCVFLVAFLLLKQMDPIQTSPVIDCDKYKFRVLYPYQRYCMDCQICPGNVESKLHNADCKKKIPNIVPGQGYAWCTGIKDRLPWCPRLTVQHGSLNCSNDNHVYSTCSLRCDFGYKPENSSWTELKCLESLHWSNLSQSELRCQRTAKPDKPLVTSLGQRQEVKAGSDKTLQCISASETVGKRTIFWFFKDKKLYGDSDLDIYVIHKANKENEGEYFCQVEDEIGASDLSAGYYLKVEETHSLHSGYQTKMEIIYGIPLFACILATVVILYWKRSRIYTCSRTLWHSITNWHHHQEDAAIKSCLSSVASSVGGSSQSSGTTGTTDATDGGSTDIESSSPLLQAPDEKVQLPQFIVQTDKSQPLETKLVLVSGKEILPSDNKVSLLPLTSALKDPAMKDPAVKDPAMKDPTLKDPNNDTLHTSFRKYDKTIEIGHNNITGINNTDQDDLRLVFKDHKLMKRIITLLDQKAEINMNKPTFHNLGRYLGDSPDEVFHFEFRCQHKELSPTEGYIKRMIEEGQGLSNLLTFFKQHKHMLELAGDIEKTVLHPYQASSD